MKNKKRKNSLESLSRRDFLKLGAAGAALGGAVSACSKKGSPDEVEEAGPAVSGAIAPRRKLGKTEMIASVLAMGGGSSLSMIDSDDEAIALIDFARQKGVNYFDSGAGYGGGKSEERFGTALAPCRREIYLSTKYGTSDGPDKLMERVEDTLKRFRTDYIDVANMHGLAELKDVENMFSSGSLETLVKLKEEGVVRYIGFSSHSSPQASLEALKRFDFDVALMAANASKVPYVGEFEGIADGSFEDEAIPFAVEKGVGVFAFKVTGQRRLIRKNNETDKAPGHELLRYAWSLPVHGIVLGMHTREHVETAAEMCADFTPMPKDEMRRWNELLAPSANELTLDYLRPDYVDDGGWRAHLA